METFIDKIKALDAEIKMTVIDETDRSEVILDGIINMTEYFKADLKILWILKEPRCGEGGGGWDLRDALNDLENDTRTGWSHTFDKIIYTSLGILNNFTIWDGMDDIKDTPSMKRVLKSVAYINLKKLPNINKTSYSNDNDILTAYNKHKSIILAQIDLFNPDIIIGGNTLKHILSDLGINSNQMIQFNYIRYCSTGNKLYIDAKHPSYWAITQSDYCDDIIQTAHQWVMKNNLK